jgi:hypothetical protein
MANSQKEKRKRHLDMINEVVHEQEYEHEEEAET